MKELSFKGMGRRVCLSIGKELKHLSLEISCYKALWQDVEEFGAWGYVRSDDAQRDFVVANVSA